MERKTKILSEIKIEFVKEYLSGKISVGQIAYQLQVSSFSVKEWIRKYKAFGVDGLISNIRNKHYLHEFKIKAITEYINGEGSLYDISIRYKISSHSVLRRWISKYNGDKTFKNHNTKGANIMTNASRSINSP